VREHQLTSVQLLLEAQPVDAGLGSHGQRGLVHIKDAIEARQVQHDPPRHGHGAALAAGATAPRDDGDAAAVRDLERRRHLVLGRGPDDHVRPAERRAVGAR
jgi:hypothetical protein